MYNAKDFAKAILIEHWDYSLPVDPVVIANKLGVKIFEDKNLDVSGYFDSSTNSIYLNTNEPFLRQRFTVAHELGHAVLGHGSSPRENSKKYDKNNYQLKEFQANEFAGELLIPTESLNYYINNTNSHFSDLCSIFLVSDNAMTVKLRRLGYYI